MPRTCGNCGPIALALAFLGSILFAFELAGLGAGVSAGATRVSLTTAGSLVASLAGLATGIRGLIAAPPVEKSSAASRIERRP